MIGLSGDIGCLRENVTVHYGICNETVDRVPAALKVYLGR